MMGVITMPTMRRAIRIEMPFCTHGVASAMLNSATRATSHLGRVAQR